MAGWGSGYIVLAVVTSFTNEPCYLHHMGEMLDPDALIGPDYTVIVFVLMWTLIKVIVM